VDSPAAGRHPLIGGNPDPNRTVARCKPQPQPQVNPLELWRNTTAYAASTLGQQGWRWGALAGDMALLMEKVDPDPI